MGIIRLLLALSVVIDHTAPLFGISLIGGSLAVQGFFVISGFYMSLILNEKYNNKSYWLYISNRLFRIYPTYWVVLILTAIVLYFYHFQGIESIFLKNYFPDVKTPYLYTNVIGIIRDLTLLLRIDYVEMILNPIKTNVLLVSQAWTLVIEIMFYLVAPFLVKRNLKFILTFSILSFILRYSFFVFFRKLHVPLSDTFFPAEIVFFMLGSLSYKLFRFLKTNEIKDYLFYLLLILFILLTVFYRFIPSIVYKFIYINDLIYVAILALLIPVIFLKIHKIKFDRFLGELSYPVYISHVLFIFLISNYKINNSNGHTLLVIFITFFGSFILFTFIDKPVNMYRQRRLKKTNR